MAAPNAEEVIGMLNDICNKVPFSGPSEWKPIWDKISAEVDAMPEGVIVDVPYEMPQADPTDMPPGVSAKP